MPPIQAIRVIFKLLNDIRQIQFHPDKNPMQTKMFQEEFLTANNIYAEFTYPVVSIDENRNYKEIEKGLWFLEKLEKKWYRYRNPRTGKSFKALGGLISNPEITKNNVVFLVSAYWMEQLVNIEIYNTSLFKIAWVFSNAKQLLLYLVVGGAPHGNHRQVRNHAKKLSAQLCFH